MRSARTLSVTPYGVPAPPKGGAFLCGGKVCLSGSYPFRLLPQRRAFAESGAANAICRYYDPFCKKVAQKRPQAFLSHKL